LTQPVPRIGTAGPTGDGNKLTPFTSARDVANRGCGGTDNGDLGVQIPKVFYAPGSTLVLEWRLTIPHPADRLDTGMRVALHYGPDDSFDCNVLLGGLGGDSGFQNTKDIQRNAIAVNAPNAAAGSIHRTIVQLPVNKTCNYCTLQWSWAARSDNGYYVSCADIAIRVGSAPLSIAEYAQLPSEAGNALPVNQPRPSVANRVCTSGGSGSSSATPVIVVIVILLLVAVLAGVGFRYYSRNKARTPAAAASMTPVPPPGGPASSALPAGWTERVDPTSGKPYYVGPGGDTSWERPAGGGPVPRAAPPPMPPVAGGLPAGWTATIDPLSGRTYYTNSALGTTQWEPPMRSEHL